MKLLAIDTATRIGSIALVAGDELVQENRFHAEVTHTEQLLPAIDAILKQVGWKLSQLNGLALAIGPGSFMGLRIGLATVKGFAQVHSLPIVGVSSLLALAHNGLLSEEPVVALLDAKRREVYAAVYEFQKGKLKKIRLKERAINPEILCKTLKKIGPCWLLGEGALVYRSLFEEALGKNAFFPPPSLMTLQARWIAWTAVPLLKKGEGKNWASLTPNYLRVSDAELQKG